MVQKLRFASFLLSPSLRIKLAALWNHDWSTLIDSKNAELQCLTGIYKNISKNAGVTLIEGRGKMVDPHTVDVHRKLYPARHILISVGGRPFLPDIPGKEYASDSDIALNLPSRPDKIAVVGGWVRDFVTEQMTLRGIEFHTEESRQAIIKSTDGLLSLKTNEGTVDDFSHVMFDTGRRPNTKVDECSRTSVDSTWAVGDVTDTVNLTPVALIEGGAAAKMAFGKEPTKRDYRCCFHV